MPDTVSCPRCGQTIAVPPSPGTHRAFGVAAPAPIIVAVECDTCRAADRAPQGEAVRLFTPAPAQLPGQTMMGV